MKREIAEKDCMILENLTKEDRLQIYKEAKILLDNKVKRFGCTALQQVLIVKRNIHIHFDDTKLFFKEWADRTPCKEKHSTIIGKCMTDLTNN
jgi:hypothetical protein